MPRREYLRIDGITLVNFKAYSRETFELDPQFTLLVGRNGTGKTSILDGLAVALGVWLVEPPDSALAGSRRSIERWEVRLAADQIGDRVQFRECLPVEVRARGGIGSCANLEWTRQIRKGGARTTNAGAAEALAVIRQVYAQDEAGARPLCPVLGYYGAGRAWLPANERKQSRPRPDGPARRWDAFYDCLNDRIRVPDLQRWFSRELLAAANRGGRPRPGYEVVKRAVLGCVPGASDVWFDADQDQIVLSIDGCAQPFGNLSAGQRVLLATVADIALKCVTQNNHLVPAEALSDGDQPLPRVLAQTPGVVLIDELDVHLHPEWQRRVADDLKRTFPSIQFVCTTHSPQVVGELPVEQVRILGPDGPVRPSVARGADANWLLDHVMATDASIHAGTRQTCRALEAALDADDLDEARRLRDGLRAQLRGETGFLAQIEGELASLELLAEESPDEAPA